MVKVDLFNEIWYDYMFKMKSITEISRERNITKTKLIKIYGLK